jgi:hypothetical protein
MKKIQNKYQACPGFYFEYIIGVSSKKMHHILVMDGCLLML